MINHKKHAPYQLSQVPITFKKSILAMCVMALSAPALAQSTDAADEGSIEEIVVSGVRSSLQNAQDIKRNADTFVDSISSKDIGSLPDRSVLEAMQRLPGVSIERFAASEDPDHFGVEGSGAVIRGMTATRSEFNGRDSFTANSGRGLSFQDVPPELMGGVDIYKNQSADMIEGGIGGTVSLRTRKPFDSPRSDPEHLGGEGSGAVIRGMTATRSEFNGRDSFTANSGRGLSFQDVPPELMGGVDIYKNQSAGMIEGGIGGTVSLRTRKPFDSP